MTEGKSPIVSVLMTAYNRESYIAEAIKSVLASSISNFELIIVDDGSKDDTVNIARKFEEADTRVRVYENAINLGDYNNRNKAAEYARGKYLKYLDSDDLIYHYGLEAMVMAMEKFPEAGFGLAATADGRQPYPVCISPSEIYKEHYQGFGHFSRAPGSSIIRSDVFKECKGFTGERMIGDMELWSRLARTCYMVKFPIDLYWCRKHSGQEFQTDYARKAYKIRGREIMEEALSHPDCPLNAKEIEWIRSEIKKAQRRNAWQKFKRRIF